MIETKLQYYINPYCQLGSPAYASEFIIAIKFFLTGEAAEWAKDNPLMQARITTQSPTNDGVQAIKRLMQNRSPQHFCEAHTFDINAKFGDLHQRLEETLLTYYKRASSMTKHVGVGDRKTGISLLLVEIAFLDGIIRSFVKSITNFSYEKEVARRLSSPARLFYSVHSIGEGAGQKKVQITKLADEEPRKKQLHYYKSLTEKNILSSCPHQSQESIGYGFSHLTTETQPKRQPVIAPRPDQPGNNK